MLRKLAVLSVLALSACASYPDARYAREPVYRDGSYYSPAGDGYGDYYYAPEYRDDDYYRYGYDGFYGDPWYGRYGYGYGGFSGWCGYDRFGFRHCPYGYGTPFRSGWSFSLMFGNGWGWGGWPYYNDYWSHRHRWHDRDRDHDHDHHHHDGDSDGHHGRGDHDDNDDDGDQPRWPRNGDPGQLQDRDREPPLHLRHGNPDQRTGNEPMRQPERPPAVQRGHRSDESGWTVPSRDPTHGSRPRNDDARNDTRGWAPREPRPVTVPRDVNARNDGGWVPRNEPRPATAPRDANVRNDGGWAPRGEPRPAVAPRPAPERAPVRSAPDRDESRSDNDRPSREERRPGSRLQ
jgi:hypothetical protein